MRDDLPHRLAAKLEELRAAAQGIEPLLVEAATAGLRTHSAPPQLSRRELSVLAMLVDGLTNRQIADELGLSMHTVKDHVSKIYRRLEVCNRTGAAKRARELQLI